MDGPQLQAEYLQQIAKLKGSIPWNMMTPEQRRLVQAAEKFIAALDAAGLTHLLADYNSVAKE